MFIKLTLSETGIEGEEIYINIKHVAAFRVHEDGTHVFSVNNDEDWWLVKESPKEILALINSQL